MKCNMCGCEEFNIVKIPRNDDCFTYIYSCQECPNMQFEYVDDEDLFNMIGQLYKNLSPKNSDYRNMMTNYIKAQTCGIANAREMLEYTDISIIRYLFCCLKDLERQDKKIKRLNIEIEILNRKYNDDYDCECD